MKELYTIIPFIITIVTISIGIYQYWDKKNQDYRKQIWEERKQLYFKVTEIASKIAILESIDNSLEERRTFWTLFYGQLAIIENQGVVNAMINYGDLLKNMELDDATFSKDILQKMALDLAMACRDSLNETWKPVPLKDLDFTS